MGYLDYLALDDIESGQSAYDYSDSAMLLNNYQQRMITNNRNNDYNYEYDRFPKNFTFTKNFNGIPSNLNATNLDKLHTEAYLTNKVKNIEKTYVGSNELPEEHIRKILPQNQGYLSGYNHQCNKCNHYDDVYHKKSNIDLSILELQKKNDILTLLLIFVAIYFVVQILFSTNFQSLSSRFILPMQAYSANIAAPVQSVPVQSAPMQSAPVQSAPVQSASMQSASMQSAPVQSAPVQSETIST